MINLRSVNRTMAMKLVVIAVGMLAFGYALGPIYNAISEMTGINVLALAERAAANPCYPASSSANDGHHNLNAMGSIRPSIQVTTGS